MPTLLHEPGTDGLREIVDVLREWQDDEAPHQLHPGDVGWFWRSGARATAAALRIWRRDGRILAVGLLDTPDVLRLTLAPDALRDAELAERLAEDVTLPERGVLGAGRAAVDSPDGALVGEVLADAGWKADEPWTPLRRDLTEPVPDPGLRIEVTGPGRAAVRTAVHRAAFGRAAFTDERWRAMEAGAPYADARCLVAYDGRGDAVAAVTVWSAGSGRPGLLEPLGVHPDHRGHGHGRAVTVAAAAALRDLGASSALVSTPSANEAAVATYRSAGFRALPETRDQRRPAPGPATDGRTAGS
ncbi:GNAT family N-acetyltransferase [Streptomyces sp. NPDC046939]|uniref:GNAT family N-acetyltransferase n=1 Tax=Streptomyces sp. NPDC046939 TaxID=3155376 RepID=UPI0033E21949